MSMTRVLRIFGIFEPISSNPQDGVEELPMFSPLTWINAVMRRTDQVLQGQYYAAYKGDSYSHVRQKWRQDDKMKIDHTAYPRTYDSHVEQNESKGDAFIPVPYDTAMRFLQSCRVPIIPNNAGRTL